MWDHTLLQQYLLVLCVLPSSGSRLLLIFIYVPNPAKYVLALMKNYVLPGNITHSTYTTN